MFRVDYLIVGAFIEMCKYIIIQRKKYNAN